MLQSRVFVLPPAVRLDPLPGAILHLRVRGQKHDFLLAVGQPAALDALTAELAERKARVLRLPASLPPTPVAASGRVGSGWCSSTGKSGACTTGSMRFQGRITWP